MADQGIETIDSLAGKIKAKYPDYAKLDNHELVSRVTTKYPDYLDHLVPNDKQKITGATSQEPLQAETPPAPPKNYGFTAGNMLSNAWQGAKELGGGLFNTAKDVIDPRVPMLQGNDSVVNKYVKQPLLAEQIKAQNLWQRGGTANRVEAAGHEAASFIPFLGPLAASLGEQAGTGDVGGAVARGGTQVAAAYLPRLAGKALDQIPSTERAGRAFQDVQSKAGKVPVDVSEPGKIALDIHKMAENGGSMPQVIRKFLNRVSDPDKPDLTYEEARQFYQNAGRLSAADQTRLTPALRRQVGMFTRALGKSVEDATASVGKQDVYKSAMKEYRQASNFKDFTSSAKDIAVDAAIKGAGLGAGGLLVKKILDK